MARSSLPNLVTGFRFKVQEPLGPTPQPLQDLPNPPTPFPRREGGAFGPLSAPGRGWGGVERSTAYFCLPPPLIGKWPQLDVAADVAPELVEAIRLEDQKT